MRDDYLIGRVNNSKPDTMSITLIDDPDVESFITRDHREQCYVISVETLRAAQDTVS